MQKTNFQLSNDQMKVKRRIDSFVAKDNVFFFTVSGQAGTGKTFIVTDIIGSKIDEYDKIFVLAPTNKATDVIRSKLLENIPKEKRILIGEDGEEDKKLICMTVDKFFSTKIRFNEDTGLSDGFIPNGLKLYKKKNSNSNLNYFVYDHINIKDIDDSKLDEDEFYYCKNYILKKVINEANKKYIIFIDECSMISELNYKFLSNFIKKTKIVFVGDKLQLPPPSSDNSYIFDLVKKKEIKMTNMTEIKRSNDDDITNIYKITRDFVTNITDRKIILKKITETGLLIHKSEMEDMIKDDIVNNKDFVVLSYTNKECNGIKNNIHQWLKDTRTQKYDYYIDTKYVMNDYYNNNLRNCQDFKIKNVIYSKKIFKGLNDVEYEGYEIITDQIIWGGKNKNASIIVLKKDHHTLYKEFLNNEIKQVMKFETKEFTKEVKDKLEENEKYGFTGIELDAKYGMSNEVANFRLEIEDDKSRTLMMKYFNMDPRIQKEYSNPKEGALVFLHEQLNICMRRDNEKFSLMYSLTVHKSQGSTFNKVYINFTNIYNNLKDKWVPDITDKHGNVIKWKQQTETEKAKLLYVASSRASNEIVFF